jgi:hypothetical protein
MNYRVIPCFLHIPEDAPTSLIEEIKQAVNAECGHLVFDNDNADRVADFLVKRHSIFDKLKRQPTL